MSAVILPKWFWSEEEEVQPPSRDGWTVHMDVEAASLHPREPRQSSPPPARLGEWLCDSLNERAR